MSSKHCESEVCVLDVFGEIMTPQEAYDAAMCWTCFPMSCDVASKQARDIVDRIKGGETKASIAAWVDEQIRVEMEAYQSTTAAAVDKDAP